MRQTVLLKPSVSGVLLQRPSPPPVEFFSLSLRVIWWAFHPPPILSPYRPSSLTKGFPGGSNDEESACNAGDLGLIPGSGRSLAKGMATHSSVLAWRIPWTEEPRGVQSMGSQRLRHKWATFTFLKATSSSSLSPFSLFQWYKNLCHWTKCRLPQEAFHNPRENEQEHRVFYSFLLHLF